MHKKNENKVEELRPLLGQGDSIKDLNSFRKLMGRAVETAPPKGNPSASQIVQQVYDELDGEAEEETTGLDLSESDRN